MAVKQRNRSHVYIHLFKNILLYCQLLKLARHFPFGKNGKPGEDSRGNISQWLEEEKEI